VFQRIQIGHGLLAVGLWWYAHALSGGGTVAEWFSQWAVVLALFIAVALICAPFEGRHSLSGRIRGILFWAIFLAAWSGAVMLAKYWMGRLGIRPLFELDMTAWGESFGAAIHAILVIVLALIPSFIYDGCYYWFHRLQHRAPLLWRFHAVHHSIEELNAANCHHHWAEGIIRLPLIILPLAMLINVRVPEAAFIGVMVQMWGQFIHADVAVPAFGIIGKIFASPQYHRVHHSLDERHMHRNFAGLYPVFDWLFGTAYLPNANEMIRTGLSDQHEPRTLREYMVALRAKD
jgi:sterol desaturase/sphingolipid hydroxylase (fatty acid hydroxylase superfamily)